MVLARETEWVWDSWYVVDGEDLHAFYLMAPKSLGDPDLRHFNARIGHSVSQNGRDWTHLPDAFGPSSGSGFDNLATWTGSIVRVDDIWHLFYTGINRQTRERVQAVGHATSPDLTHWTRVSEGPIARAEAPYALLGNGHDGAEHFRDPWVFQHDGDWHMLVSASDEAGWGTVAHATSPDLTRWQVKEPLVRDSKLLQLEVTEVLETDGTWVLVFCMQPKDVFREGVAHGFATYSAPAAGPLGPFDLDHAEIIADGIYAARAVFFQDEWQLFGFIDNGTPGGFTGTIGDPIPLQLSERGTLIPR